MAHRAVVRRRGGSHDSLYAAQDYDPFTFAYPGYITIRRFADLAAPYLEESAVVFDLGCGPGEISCELGSRFPEVAVLGVDHSAEAIRMAQTNAARRGLTNVRFERADVERFEPDRSVDLVMMFDAFHHLTDLTRFVERLARRSRRFLLVEPRGDWHGGWRKDLEFDWVVTELGRGSRRRMHGSRPDHETVIARSVRAGVRHGPRRRDLVQRGGASVPARAVPRFGLNTGTGARRTDRPLLVSRLAAGRFACS